jgi:predicted naringenin-chalcone synthase
MPTFCLDPSSDILRAIYSSNSRRLLRNRLEVFQGHSAALSVTTEEGQLKTSEVEATELTEIPLTEGLFTPSADMKRARDMHTLRVTTQK